MNEITISRLEMNIQFVQQSFLSYSEESFREALSPGKWSRLQILGHLCDSAINNINRFITIQQQREDDSPLPVVPYQQDLWVQAQAYGDAPAQDVMSLWIQLNRSVIRILSGMIDDHMNRSFRLPDGQIASCEFFIQDYADHMEHHIKQMFPAIDSF